MKLSCLFGLGLIQPSRNKSHSARCHSWRGLVIFLGALCLLLAWLGSALAADGALDPAFEPGEGVQQLPGMRGRINYDDGTNRFLIWGYFTSINGVARGSLARFNADGSLDAGFNPPIEGEVRSVYLLSDGKILVGGRISVGSSSPYHYNLARLNSDGALDSTFSQILDWYGMVNSVKVQTDGKVLVGGWSMTVLGDASATYHLLRLNANGTVDNSYPKRSAPGGLVNGINVLTANDARIYGYLPNISGNHTGYLVTLSLSGNLVSYLGDETFNGTIYDFATQTDGKKVYVGQFNQVLGVPRKYIARLNTNGALDTSFDPGVGPNGRVNNLVIQADDKLVVAGNFNTFNNNPVGYAVRLNTDGTVDPSFAGAADDRIQRLDPLNGTGPDLVAFGWFRNFNGAARPGLAYLDSNGNLSNLYAGWTSANTDTADVYALGVQPNGQVYVGGDFTGVGGKMHRGLARLNRDGSLDNSFRGGVDGYVKGIARQADGQLLVAGYFGEANGLARTSLARFGNNASASLDRDFFPIITKLDGSVADLKQATQLANGQVMVAGHLRKAGGLTRTAVVRLNADGALDTAFDAQITITSGTNVRANRVAEVDGKYVVAGYVTFEGLARGFLCRLTGTGALDTTFGPTAAPTPSPNVNITAGEVKDLALQKDGRIMVCGDFVEIIDGSFWDRPQRGRIARFTAAGLLDGTFTTITGANNYIEAMALQPNGRILIGGSFTGYNLPNIYPTPPGNRNRIARVLSNGDLDESFNPGSGLEEPTSASYKVRAYALTWLSSGKAVIGGYFSLYNGVSRNQLAQVFAGPANFSPATLSLLLLMDN